jgi:putative protease
MEKGLRTKASKPELLSPGGSLDKLRIAFLYGADAVYASGKEFGLRGFANNLDTEQLAAASLIAHRLGRKIYVAVNVFARQADLKKIPQYLEYLRELKIDALIISDPGVLLLARKYASEIPIHLSTQANTTNSSSVEFWQDQGVRRINLARELSFQEIAEIAEKTAAEIEIFVHGAMCMSYSGRCLMSAFLNAGSNRSANSGFCTQPCRWSWGLVEEKRPGEVFSVEQDSRGAYIFNSKDLCLLEEIGSLALLGIDSFKIEGRMKGALYVSSVTRAYRQAIDSCADGKSLFRVAPDWIEDLQRVSHRPYTKGNLLNCAQTPESSLETRISYIQTDTLAGLVRPCPESDSLYAEAGGKIFLETRSRLICGQTLEFLYPDGSNAIHRLDSFEDLNGNRITQAHPNRWIRFGVDFPVMPFQTVRVSNGI